MFPMMQCAWMHAFVFSRCIGIYLKTDEYGPFRESLHVLHVMIIALGVLIVAFSAIVADQQDCRAANGTRKHRARLRLGLGGVKLA